MLYQHQGIFNVFIAQKIQNKYNPKNAISQPKTVLKKTINI